MSRLLPSFLAGEWVRGRGEGTPLVDPTSEETIARASSDGLDLARALDHARKVGGPALRRLSFAERGALLQTLADAVHAQRDALIETCMLNGGNTRSDAKFDVDGGARVLQAFAELASGWSDQPWLPDGGPVEIGASKRLGGRHVRVPIPGVAVCVNAYNFPVWGLLEKAAAAWLAGVPVFAKPATATALPAVRLVEILLETGALPDGALSLLTGPAGDLLSHLDGRDALSFTGSSATARRLRADGGVVERSVRLNVEADSLNACVLGPDVEPGGDTFDLFLGDVIRDLTQKAGQKCTAIRRVFVPRARLDAAADALAERLAGVVVGDPFREEVRMGPLAHRAALAAAREGLAHLERCARAVFRGGDDVRPRPGFEGKGCFLGPVLLAADAAAAPSPAHEVEVFGPVATLFPYDDLDEAFAGVRRGGGGLVASVHSDDRTLLRRAVVELGGHHGRLYLGTRSLAGLSPGPGTALPELLHGGPGRAGGGGELGGLRALSLYTQLVALEGYAPLLRKVAGP